MRIYILERRAFSAGVEVSKNEEIKFRLLCASKKENINTCKHQAMYWDEGNDFRCAIPFYGLLFLQHWTHADAVTARTGRRATAVIVPIENDFIFIRMVGMTSDVLFCTDRHVSQAKNYVLLSLCWIAYNNVIRKFENDALSTTEHSVCCGNSCEWHFHIVADIHFQFGLLLGSPTRASVNLRTDWQTHSFIVTENVRCNPYARRHDANRWW